MSAQAVRADVWLRRYREARPGAVRLLCFPHAGGAANFFLPFSRQLSPMVETLAVQYPGRHDRLAEPPARSIAALADGVVAALAEREEGRSGPLVLFGHSLGAVVAFEVARRLERGPLAGPTAPTALIVSACRAPSRLRPGSIHLRDDGGVLAELQRLGGTAGDLLGNEELVRMFLPTVRADYAALAAYTELEPVTRPLACPIMVMAGDYDPVVPVDDALAWAQFTTGGFASELFPGGHFYLTSCVDQVTESILRMVKTHA
ncbi:thioesterase II family protein [Streptomyces europaeiscabiei]|uniref:thioesterase II family protein n=1 Tax=Streptomyces europaeiscabiei TaxID=146819 RepID=UPI002E28A25F|nr:alpha/beta fold hydrolase [Streptomyces europaeiscabiei]